MLDVEFELTCGFPKNGGINQKTLFRCSNGVPGLVHLGSEDHGYPRVTGADPPFPRKWPCFSVRQMSILQRKLRDSPSAQCLGCFFISNVATGVVVPIATLPSGGKNSGLGIRIRAYANRIKINSQK